MQKNYYDTFIIFFSNCYALLVKTKGFHWNVHGENFFSLHAFFDDAYSMLEDEIDVFAERMRALETYPPGSLSHLLRLQTLETSDEPSLTSVKMVEVFLKNAHTVIQEAKELCDISAENDDLTTQDLLLEFIYKLEKIAWMGRSYLQ